MSFRTINCRIIATLLCSVAWITSTSTVAEETPAKSTNVKPSYPVPMGLAKRTVPTENPLTKENVALGERLFFDKSLSADGTVSCATCHKKEHGFATSDPIAIGIDSRKGKRNAPSLLNRAFGTSQFWDGRVTTLEQQAVLPIENPDEMGHDFLVLLPKLKSRPELVQQFSAAFADSKSEPDPELITKENIGKALAAFQRTLLMGDSPVDQFQNGNHSALTVKERTGMWLFESRAKCWKCHSGRNFTDEKFHNTGVSHGTDSRDTGRFQVTKKDADQFKFKTPTLRGVSLTAPYFHDGSVKTLEGVVRFYNKGGSPADKSLDGDVEKLNLTDEQVDQLVAFLKALSRTSAAQ